jgi:hypothetical protein
VRCRDGVHVHASHHRRVRSRPRPRPAAAHRPANADADADVDVAVADDETPGGGDTWNFVTRVAFDVHIPLGVVSPFVGVFGGWLYGDSSVDDTFIAGPEVGAKIYLQRDAFLFAGAEWQFYFDEQDTLDAAFEDGQFFYSAGFGLRF